MVYSFLCVCLRTSLIHTASCSIFCMFVLKLLRNHLFDSFVFFFRVFVTTRTTSGSSRWRPVCAHSFCFMLASLFYHNCNPSKATFVTESSECAYLGEGAIEEIHRLFGELILKQQQKRPHTKKERISTNLRIHSERSPN